MLAKEGWEIYTRDYVDCVIVNNDPIYQLNDGLDWIDFFEWAQNGQQQKCEKNKTGILSIWLLLFRSIGEYKVKNVSNWRTM